jgi:hypothetical protein
MALARTHSVALVGVQGHLVEVEADIANGLVGMVLVGLPDAALREARDRIRSAIVNSGEQWPQRRITVGLSPASLPKRGSGFDLPIAIAVLAAAGVVRAAALAGVMFLGELGLDGQLRPVRGVLPAAVAAAAAGLRDVVVARANAQEAALVPGLRVLSAPTLAALLTWMRGEPPAGGTAVEELAGGTIASLSGAAPAVPGTGGDAYPGKPAVSRAPSPDLSDVLGQPVARRAAEICAAGGHHLSLLGPPGAGKTMLELCALDTPWTRTVSDAQYSRSEAIRCPSKTRTAISFILLRTPWATSSNSASHSATAVSPSTSRYRFSRRHVMFACALTTFDCQYRRIASRSGIGSSMTRSWYVAAGVKIVTIRSGSCVSHALM